MRSQIFVQKTNKTFPWFQFHENPPSPGSWPIYLRIEVDSATVRGPWVITCNMSAGSGKIFADRKVLPATSWKVELVPSNVDPWRFVCQHFCIVVFCCCKFMKTLRILNNAYSTSVQHNRDDIFWNLTWTAWTDLLVENFGCPFLCHFFGLIVIIEKFTWRG